MCRVLGVILFTTGVLTRLCWCAAAQASSIAASADGNTGTWNGPAPRGAPAGQREAAGARAAAAQQQPTSVLLNSGARMPLLGYGTYNVKGADAVRCARGRAVACFPAFRVMCKPTPSHCSQAQATMVATVLGLVLPQM